MVKTLQCPTCKKPVQWTTDFPERPFCSKRCRLIDLGAWADESYAIPDPKKPINDAEIDHEDPSES